MIALLPFLLALSSDSFASPVSPETIYGPDSRTDWYQITDASALRLADSSVALIEAKDLGQPKNGFYEVTTPTFGKEAKLCPGERFAEQQALAFCSGVLIHRQLVLTAGHCIKKEQECRNARLTFEFTIRKPGELPTRIDVKDVYRCSRIVKRSDSPDFAILELDRPVPDHGVAEPSTQGEPADGGALWMVGYPNGLPLKLADGRVRNGWSWDGTLQTTLDAFAGNSGSPVFSKQTGLLVGLLVEGDKDYVNDGSCKRPYRCSEGDCLAQGVTRISDILPYWPKK